MDEIGVDNHISSAEAENETNNQDAYTYQAIDALMNSPEQTYDEFMENFMFLKKGDVVRPTPVPVEAPVPQVAASRDNVSVQSVAQERVDCDLDVEILEEGTQTPSIFTRQSSDGTASVQLDNFVEDEGEENLSDEEDGCKAVWEDVTSEENTYQASFTPTDAKKEKVPSPVSTAEHSKQERMKASIEIHDNHTQDAIPFMPEDTGVALYPGEVEEVQQSPREKDIRKISQLDFSTATGGPVVAENKESQGEKDLPTDPDEVQPFSLDEDFDYDNVVLTPKFSSEEMEMMRIARQNNGFI
ncbi:uncharacterized protein C11orf74 homolog [Lingula anatina]|uniref:Uncharacterized protein C11orf74 homolog n=1 Tax=Lingula anatina TaxID=7574 RepID=A0A1S3HMR7_LINAN|nr:uncharacterized protein C11orf74 homolog [Lingula anatina]XP_013386801.1 uncharacterized protein C11orf74 homolog [Lingula anatina]|eukprot:XP_013386800.1 uncharacterized protein C11orf74 homolog [Lingula anatina]